MSWSYLHRKPDERREAVIAELVSGGKAYYLFEMSRRENEKGKYRMMVAARAQGQPLGTYTLDAVLKQCVRNAGVWLKADDLPELSRQFLKHTSKDEESFAKRIYALLSDETKWMR